MERLDTERQERLEPDRILAAKESIEAMGYECSFSSDGKSLRFIYDQHIVQYFPYTGWATGKTIKDGRGLVNLLKQIKPLTNK